MTIEEAKTFLDNLKVCVIEHPIVADWLVEIADRKTEPSGYNLSPVEDEPLTCDGNCWMKKQNGEWLCEHCQRKPQTEPTISKMEQVEDETQTERSSE